MAEIVEETQDIVRAESEPERVKEVAKTLQEGAKNIVAWRTPKDFIQTRVGRGGMNFSYVDIGFIELMLNNLYPKRWSFEIVNDKIVGNSNIVVTGRLTIRNPDGTENKYMQYGSSEIKFQTEKVQDPKDPKKYTIVKTDKPVDVADDFKAAASDCLKKCASMIGIAFDVYHPKTKAALDTFIDSREG